MTQCGWLRLCTTVAMGMTITNCWKLFCYGVKRYHYDKFISIREFSERLAVDCFSNPFTTGTWTPANNIPSLDYIDNKVTVPTCSRLNYSSSSTHNSDISTILDITIAAAATTSIGHTALKEVEKEGGRYNREASGYFNWRLTNGKRCMKRSIWYCNGCYIWFGRRTY